MQRSALRTYLRRLLIASSLTPLGGCDTGGNCAPPGPPVVVHPDGGYQGDGGVGDGGELDHQACSELCPSGYRICKETSDDAGAAAVECTEQIFCGTGR